MTAIETPLPISRTLARFIVDARFRDLDLRALQQTRYAVLDALGVSIAATTLGEGVTTFIEWVKEQQASGPCSVLAQGFLTTPSMAAFANGALAHALDFEDAHDGALVHPNAAVIPAALAIAQSREDVTAGEFLIAIAVGCEVTSRLGMAAARIFDQNSWYPPPILSAYGATAAAAKLLKLNEQQILDGFSLCLSQATCSAEIKHNSQSHIREIRDAFPAQTAVVSAQLAQKGLAGFEQPLEGKDGFFAGFTRGNYDSKILTDGLGETFAIADISFKPWPSCRGTHIPIEMSLDLCAENSVSSDMVNSVTVYSNNLNRMLAEPIVDKRTPRTAIDAKFSIPFCVACAVVNGNVDLNSFSAESLINPSILEVAAKVNYRVDDKYSSPVNGRVEILLNDGRMYAAEALDALGSPARPLSAVQLLQKFRHCLSHSANSRHVDIARDTNKAEQLAAIVLNLGEDNSLHPLFSYL